MKEEKNDLYRTKVNQLLVEGEKDLAKGRSIKITNKAEQDALFEKLAEESSEELAK